MSVYKRKGSPFYQYEFEISKQRFRGSTKLTSRREAEAFEQAEQKRRRAELDAGISQKVVVEVPSVADVFARYWKAHGCKLGWAGAVKDHMNESLAVIGPDTPLDRWTNAVVAEVLDEYASADNRNYKKTDIPPKVSNTTVNLRLAVMRQIWRKARDAWDMSVANIKWSEHVRKQPRERVRHVTVEQARDVIRLLPKHIQIMVAWSLATGCRLSETHSVKWSRVNYETLQAEVDTKGGGTRFADLSPDAVAVLSLCDRENPPDHLRIGRNDSYVFDATNRRKHWEAAVEAVGLEDFHWHDLRHTFATWLGSSGAGLHVIQKALGHSKIETTMKYLHVIRGDVRAAVSKLPAVLTDETDSEDTRETDEKSSQNYPQRTVDDEKV